MCSTPLFCFMEQHDRDSDNMVTVRPSKVWPACYIPAWHGPPVRGRATREGSTLASETTTPISARPAANAAQATCLAPTTTIAMAPSGAPQSLPLLRDMGTHGSPPTTVSVIPDRRVRPTRRPADLLVGPARPDMWAQGHEDSLEYKTRQTSSDKLSLL
jgi:hypothetical protein